MRRCSVVALFATAEEAVLSASHRVRAPQDAANCVLKAVEQRPWIIFARMSLYKAIHRTDNEMPPAPQVKKADTWRERRRAQKATLQ